MEESNLKVKNTILVVDDSRDTVLLMRKALVNRGYPVLTANNPTEALKIFQEHPEIQLILIDINLEADVNGVVLAKQFNEFKKERLFSMCFVSGARVDDTFLQASQKLGVDGFISKPINIERLQTKVEDLLGAHFDYLDLSAKIQCNLPCELINVNILPLVKIIQITPGSFLLASSADYKLGTILSIQCPSLEPILIEKYFTLKVLKTKRNKSHIESSTPFVARCQILEQSYQVRLSLSSLFQKKDRLPEGMIRLDIDGT